MQQGLLRSKFRDKQDKYYIVICVIQPWNIPFWRHSCKLTSSDLPNESHNFIVMLKLRYNKLSECYRGSSNKIVHV